MKALKLVLVTVLVSFAMMSYAQDFQGIATPQHSKAIALIDARGMPDLVDAIYAQINPEALLAKEGNTFYVAYVKVKKNAFRICGTYSEWYDFFYAKHKFIPFEKADKSKKEIE